MIPGKFPHLPQPVSCRAREGQNIFQCIESTRSVRSHFPTPPSTIAPPQDARNRAPLVGQGLRQACQRLNARMLLPPICRGRNRGSGMLTNLPESSQLGTVGIRGLPSWLLLLHCSPPLPLKGRPGWETAVPKPAVVPEAQGQVPACGPRGPVPAGRSGWGPLPCLSYLRESLYVVGQPPWPLPPPGQTGGSPASSLPHPGPQVQEPRSILALVHSAELAKHTYPRSQLGSHMRCLCHLMNFAFQIQ